MPCFVAERWHPSQYYFRSSVRCSGTMPILPNRHASAHVRLETCPTLAVLLRRTIHHHLRHSRIDKLLPAFQRIRFGFSGPCAAHLATPPSPRQEGNVGHDLRSTIRMSGKLSTPSCIFCVLADGGFISFYPVWNFALAVHGACMLTTILL